VHNNKGAVNPDKNGTKASPHYMLRIDSGATETVRLRLSDKKDLPDPLGDQFESSFNERLKEADEFYNGVSPFPLTEELRSIQRQAFAGMLWSKQFYHYVVGDWLKGDPAAPPPPVERKNGQKSGLIVYNDISPAR
jgi:hypothetical protein